MPTLTITAVAGPLTVKENVEGSAVQTTRTFYLVRATDGATVYTAQVAAPYSTAAAQAALQAVYTATVNARHPDQGKTVVVT